MKRELVEELEVGDWRFDRNGYGVWLRVPHVRNAEVALLHLHVCAPGEVHPSAKTALVWAWTGGEEKPTLAPSIRSADGDGEFFHGFLRDGKLVLA